MFSFVPSPATSLDGAPRRPRRRRNPRPAAQQQAHNQPARNEPPRNQPTHNQPTHTETRPQSQAVQPIVVSDPGEPKAFSEVGLPARLVRILTDQGITDMFPIQQVTLPDTLAGRDVLGRGRTGSGKTLAFALPMVARLSGGTRTPSHPTGLILVPTRELATQVHATLEPFARAAGLRTTTVFGGVGQNPQVRALRSGVDILVACPGRLEDLIAQRQCFLDEVSVTVLDEADHMADLGFLPAVRRLLDKTPADGQRMLFSATLDKGVDVLVRRYLNQPVTHAVDTPQSPVTAMVHHVLTVTAADKPVVLRRLAAGADRSLLFTRTKHGARKLARSLTSAGLPAVDLHGNLSQSARERNLAAFSTGEVRVLVATDIAARGIHVDDVGLVVHADPPAEHKAYLHRSGRTARAGAAGVVVTLALPEQIGEVRTMTRRAGIAPQTTDVTPQAPLLAELAGPEMPPVAPEPVRQPTHQPGRSSSRPARPSRGTRPRRPRRTG
jgi:superfamily II DNA/RNA helicase